jgi:hypothetical protein
MLGLPTSPALSALGLPVSDVTILLGLVVLALILSVARLVRRPSSGRARTRTPTHPRGPHPRSRVRQRPKVVPFSYWYAIVPFEDTTEVKERPVLVLRQDGTNAKVLKVTSQTKAGRANYRRVDTSRWDRPGAGDGSWIRTDRVVTVPLAGFRRCLGSETDVAFTRELTRLHGNEFF